MSDKSPTQDEITIPYTVDMDDIRGSTIEFDQSLMDVEDKLLVRHVIRAINKHYAKAAKVRRKRTGRNRK